jgi:predicted ATPase
LVRGRVLHGVDERFDFTHERVREVVYSQLLRPRRKVLHLQVAKAIEDLYAGSLELQHATLAAHYRAGELWDQAFIHFRAAGARAMRFGAYHEAATCFEQALDVLGQGLHETR